MTGQDQGLKVLSPLSGWCASLDDSPDPVFQARMLGDGVSIDPTVGEVRAPFDAEVLTVPESRHAINLRARNGAEFLIHVGIDTVNMRGDGFEAHVQPGQQVEAGQLLLSFDLEKVLRGAASLRTPVLLLQSDAHTVQRVRDEGAVTFDDVIFEVHRISSDAQTADSPDARGGEKTDGSHSRTVVIGLKHGIHARPAAGLIDAIKALDASVNLVYGGQTADLRSPVALMSLSTERGARVTVNASGPDALRALEAVVAGLEPLADGESAPAIQEDVRPEIDDEPPEPIPAGAVIRALSASPGLGRGSAFLLREQSSNAAAKAGSPEEERGLLVAAVERVRAYLGELATADAETGAEIARAHLALLDDPLVADRAHQLVDQGLASGAAWQRAVQDAIKMLSRVEDPRMRERVDDLKDINLRVQRVLAGEDPRQGIELPDRAVVLAENLLPSQLLEMDRKHLAGICLAGGGVTSHVAILAISMNVPMLVASGKDVLAIEAGADLLLDGELGELHVSPQAEAAERFAARINEQRRHGELAAGAARQPCFTRDDVQIHIHANIASAADAKSAVACGAEGCGLLRTEFLFMDRLHAPDAEEQLRAYRAVSTELGDRPLVVRTLDAGGDKPIGYIQQAHEENPALGVRGVRLSLAHRGLLETQLQALLQLDHPEPVRVMIPMVSSADEVEEVRGVLARLGADPSEGRLKLGVMVETPAAAMIADRLAEMVDFFSIGTNDLTQYTLCMDRGEPALARSFDTLHPGVLRLIRQTARAADRAGIPVAVCGAAAGDPIAAPLLLGLGIRELSMPAGLIARQKANLRKISMAECEKLAATALERGSARAVRELVREFVMV
jgi:phosphocarrier protein FPr/phosphocarrier protein